MDNRFEQATTGRTLKKLTEEEKVRGMRGWYKKTVRQTIIERTFFNIKDCSVRRPALLGNGKRHYTVATVFKECVGMFYFFYDLYKVLQLRIFVWQIYYINFQDGIALSCVYVPKTFFFTYLQK